MGETLAVQAYLVSITSKPPIYEVSQGILGQFFVIQLKSLLIFMQHCVLWCAIEFLQLLY